MSGFEWPGWKWTSTFKLKSIISFGQKSFWFACSLYLSRILSFAFQMFVLVLFWFQLYNGFSGSNAIDDLSLIFFNLLFTAVPPVICAVLDKDVPDAILTAKPDLYKSGQDSKVRGCLHHKSLFVFKEQVHSLANLKGPRSRYFRIFSNGVFASVEFQK